MFETKIPRNINRKINENGIWKSRFYLELYKLYITPETVKVIKAGRLRWLGHHSRMQEQNPCKQPMFQKSQDTRQLGRLPMRWLVSELTLDTGSQVTRLGPVEGNGKGS
jgi:hypothetical protein